MAELFSDDESPTKKHALTINEYYAKAFEYRKEREELERLKAKYGSDYDPEEESTDSESAESEDEFGEELTPTVDAAILRTLARIRKKDPDIYDSEKNIFTQEQEKVAGKAPTVDGQTKSKEKSKPVTIRQVNLDAMLHGSRSPSPEPLTHVQEQEALRKETIAVFHNAVAEDGDDDFLIPREKTQDEREREGEEYRAFLEREVGDLRDLVSVDGSGDEKEQPEASTENRGDEEDEKKKKKRKKKQSEVQERSKVEEDQEFLMNYILNRGWIDKSRGHIPTYKEVTHESTEKRGKKGKAKDENQDALGSSQENENSEDEEMDTGMLSDTSFESIASYFEASYNHRFEEPGASTIPSFPRVLQSTVRREDTKRKDARERRKLRKEEEMNKKRDEVKRLKALKMRELRRKLEMVSKEGGLKKKKTTDANEGEDDMFVDEALKDLDLEGEWDPEKHDRQMASLFDRDANAYEDEGEGFEDEEVTFDENGKPVWDDDIDIGEIPMDDEDDVRTSKQDKKKKKKKKKKAGEEDEGGVNIDVMDADFKPTLDDDEEWDGTEEMRKRKLNEYMDEIYGLEFNDLIGDMPTRFKYTKVEPQNFSLTPVEILMATDQELNEYMSVKKYAPYRQDKNRWSHKNQEKLREIKTKITERSGGALGGDKGYGRNREEGEKPTKKRKGKKERMRLKATASEGEGEEGDGDEQRAFHPKTDNAENNGGSKKNKKRKREQDLDNSVGDGTNSKSDEFVDGGGGELSNKKKRKRNRKKHGEPTEPPST